MSLQTVTGTVTLSDPAPLSDAVATVKLVDAEGDVLAATAVEADSVPVPFTLTVDPEAARGDLFLWAMLRAESGGWGTFELVPVEGDTEVVLTSVDG